MVRITFTEAFTTKEGACVPKTISAVTHECHVCIKQKYASCFRMIVFKQIQFFKCSLSSESCDFIDDDFFNQEREKHKIEQS